MSQRVILQQQAIQAAKEQDWSKAVTLNGELLTVNPQDVGALNRLGVAYLQLGKMNQAKGVFEQVFHIDRSNKLAKKHLERIKHRHTNAMPSFPKEPFIEEPGKTKSVELYRLAGKDILENLSIGQECQLQPKNRYISVSVGEMYLGSLPEDLSFRLTKLIKTGNEYSCRVRSCSATTCTVHLRETTRSKKNQDINSFPTSRGGSVAAINDVDESMLEDDIPVEIVSTDTDSERSLEEFDSSDDE